MTSASFDEGRLTSDEARKAAFARRLCALMAAKSLTVTALAKLIQAQMPERNFNSVNISHYRSGRSLPRPQILTALARALDVSIEELAANSNEPLATGPRRRKRSQAAQPLSDAPMPAEVESQPALDPNGGDAAPAFHLEDLKDGEAWIQINQRLSWDMVLKLLQVLKGEKGG